ncbi:MAG: Gfo/Idh/MocA family oxidoreductase [Steroidobacteraceae bacterium]|nr:Gfo/Idh/MocA family oxidoreductase [Steroidobacteraceae bacterium]
MQVQELQFPVTPAARPELHPLRPRLGFVGVGWIGAHRLEAVASSQAADVVGIADARPEATRDALRRIAPHAPRARAMTFDRLLESGLDGIVIATPNAAHAEQSIAALESGLAVFCQKPLSRTAAEAQTIVDTARRCDRLLDVDFCYRHVSGVAQMAELVRSGALGQVFAANLVFHNAYGPDKAWFNDPEQAGGGCVMDLGIHLIDLLLWVTGFPQAERVESRLYSRGTLLRAPQDELEDYADVTLALSSGMTAHLACSWRISAGCDAVIEAAFYGTRGGVRLRNIGGSFYDFTVEHCEGTRCTPLSTHPDDWGGRAICDWARRLANSARFDERATHLVQVSHIVDRTYGR